MKTILLWSAVAAALVAVPALAQDRGRSTTRADVQARTAAAFATVDANRDGFVTRAEADAQRGAMQGNARATHAKKMGEHFAELDRDRNGSISRAEFDAHHAMGKGARAERQEARGERREARMEQRGALGLRMNPRAFERADANRDGRLTLAEAQVQPLARFTAADTNRDGMLTRDERRAQRDKRQARRAERRES